MPCLTIWCWLTGPAVQFGPTSGVIFRPAWPQSWCGWALMVPDGWNRWCCLGDKGSELWETRRIVGSSPTTVVNNDVTSHRTNPLDPVFSPVFGIYSGVRHCHVCTSELSGKSARLPDCYCFLGVSIHDCRDSQPSSGWLRKVGVLDFRFRLPDCYCFLGVSIHDCRDSQPSSGWLKKVSVLISFPNFFWWG